MYNNSVHLNIKSIFLTNYFKPLFQNGVSKLQINLGMKLNAILFTIRQTRNNKYSLL